MDRAALDAAIALGIPHGGWCPRGRSAEDGPIPDRYELIETDSTEYRVRTERNVLDSDATLILFRERIGGGTELTLRLARQHGRPHLAIDLDDPPSSDEFHAWMQTNQVGVLNVAGPRESQNPDIAAAAQWFLQTMFEA